MTHWAMVIDLTKCVGCDTCIKVCREGNHTPENASWRWSAGRLIRIRSGDDGFFVTLNCMHCEKPSCVKVCPTSATHCRSDGIVDIDHKLCAGCGACIEACPYGARKITRIDTVPTVDTGPANAVPYRGDRIGTCTKCNFCRHRIDKARKNDLVPGIDPAATPLCVRFCLSEALSFGDLDNPESNVSRLLADRKSVRLRQDLDNGPSVYYLY